ncbi:MAG: class I SAM-dependent methyltransferase [Methylococcales bacterium]|jgi:ubiquinone/menaquinone biosynthesis C-methylase UbiE|nr:class I SAM-dependent methyltransferase [Methylococcales bacterium]MBT7445957.1 class I SAM-dependent methyltransferase [Methylococcales bacterium]
MSSIISTFDAVAGGYDSPNMRFFPFAADLLAAKAKIFGRQKILDVAAGTGMVSIAAAQMASTGRVMAIDLSAGMLAKAEVNCRKMALTNIDYFEMDGQDVEFKRNYFDHVLCGFGLFFFSDIQKGLLSWKRVMKPGAKVGFSSFLPSSFSPMAELFITRLQAYGYAKDFEVAQKLDSVEKCEQTLSSAGFENIQISQQSMGYHIATGRDWWDVVWNTALRSLLDNLSDDELERFQVEHMAEVEALAVADGIYLPVDVLFSFAEKPD